MKTENTHYNLRNSLLRGMFVVFILMFSFDNYAQIIVGSVSPRRVTTNSKVTITGAPTIASFGSMVCTGIYSITGSTYTINSSRTLAVLTILKNDLEEVNDVGPTPLLIDNKTVHTGSPAVPGLPGSAPGANQVFLEYVAPAEKTYTSSSDFRVTEVFTSWDKNDNGFWRSGNLGTGGKPNDSHDLLAFTTPLGTFSTGVADKILADNNINLTSSQTFKAYSTNGVSGNTHDQNYLAMADLIDGKPDAVELNDRVRATVYDVLIDGRNGLDMGSGITNLNRSVSVKFYSGNGNLGSLDDIPDLLITQIADPGKADIYFYSDIDGNIVGRPIILSIAKTSPKLFDWRLDLYNMRQNVSYDISYPTGAGFSAGQERAFRMVAFRIQDFGINNKAELDKVNNINMMAGGEADIAFIAYNTGTFAIKSPQINEFPVSRNICELSDAIVVKFSTDASVVAPTGDNKEIITYQWFKDYAPILNATSKTYTLPSPITEQDLLTYKVRVKNWFGAIDLSAKLSKGGIVTYWYGPDEGWVHPSNYYNSSVQIPANLKFPIANADRNLIFAENYSENVDLEGCDCIIEPGNNVIIPDGKTLTLYNTITVEDAIPATGEPGSIAIPKGTFTLMDNASLVQMKPLPVNVNENFGEITVNRLAKGLKKYDYVYWSSPVENGKVSMIPGATQHVYRWDVNTENSNNTRGNWGSIPGGIMENGRGYIKRVNGEPIIPSVFVGTPNNGLIEVDVLKTLVEGSTAMNEDTEKHLNLLGNPYPSAINAETFLVQNTMLEGYVKIWSHEIGIFASTAGEPFYGGGFKYNYGDQYFTYNKMGTVPEVENSFAGKIASGQGFFVKVLKSASINKVSFSNDMRYTVGQTNYDNTKFYRGIESSQGEVQTEKQLIWLSLVNEKNVSSVALIGYAEGATNGKDRLYDANSGSGDMRIYSVLDNSDLIIQGRALPFEESDQVPLGIEILKNGIYKIGIDHLKGSVMTNEEQDIYLEDTYNSVIHNLRTAPYNFTATVGDVKDRFVLRYTNKTLSVQDNQMSDTFVYVKNEQLYVKAAKNIESVVVYDLTGKKLMDYKLDRDNDRFNTPFQFPKGAYLTVIKLENAGSVTKKMMN